MFKEERYHFVPVLKSPRDFIKKEAGRDEDLACTHLTQQEVRDQVLALHCGINHSRKKQGRGHIRYFGLGKGQLRTHRTPEISCSLRRFEAFS